MPVAYLLQTVGAKTIGRGEQKEAEKASHKEQARTEEVETKPRAAASAGKAERRVESDHECLQIRQSAVSCVAAAREYL